MKLRASRSSCDGIGFDAAQLRVLIHKAFVLAGHSWEQRAKDSSYEYFEHFECVSLTPGESTGSQRAEGAGSENRRRQRVPAGRSGRPSPGTGHAGRSVGLRAADAKPIPPDRVRRRTPRHGSPSIRSSAQANLSNRALLSAGL
jgi:hypothetical protein